MRRHQGRRLRWEAGVFGGREMEDGGGCRPVTLFAGCNFTLNVRTTPNENFSIS